MVYPLRRLVIAGIIPVPLVLLVSFAPSIQPPQGTGPLMSKQGLLQVRHVTVSIAQPPDVVYEFAARPENMPKWAAGLGASFRQQSDGSWLAEGGPVGTARVRYVERNQFGVLDHDVTIATGETVHNPVRVIPNGDGSEIVFTLYRRPGVTSAEFERDAKAVEQDLRTLKRLLEGSD